ncbi:MAG: hypothetical protein L0H36_00660 [bacterium]|nr:hypothetical protein [bacterium]MDN5835129.1 hypothetical protein [bacterium]
MFGSKFHDCEKERRFDVNRNRAVAHFGVVWQCPDCQAFWYREIEFIDGASLLYLGDDATTWRRMTGPQVRKLQKHVRKGRGQLEIARRMKYPQPRWQGDSFQPTWLEGIERYNQDPKNWVFD